MDLDMVIEEVNNLFIVSEGLVVLLLVSGGSERSWLHKNVIAPM